MNPIHRTSKELHALGIRTIPVRADGTKAPALRDWQNHPTSLADIDSWFGGERPRYGALGIVTGVTSGNLEMTEIEGEYVHLLNDLETLAHDSNLGDLWDKLKTGWVERSPSGGIHWIYRVSGVEVPGNTKIAQGKTRHTENGGRYVPTIAETRGTGGQFVAAPTGDYGLPAAHETGNPWVRISGSHETMVTLDEGEREAFHSLLATLDEREAEKAQRNPTASSVDTRPVTGMTGLLGTLEHHHRVRLESAGLSPGDDYENKTEWAEILEPMGWTRLQEIAGTVYWCRPGKTSGISATTGRSNDRDRLYVFSSSTEFPTLEPITKFYAYALLYHGGNSSAAAAALRSKGYGEPAKVTHPSAIQAPVMTAQAGEVVSSGNTEPVHIGQGAGISQAPGEPHRNIASPDFMTTVDLTDDSNAMALVANYGDQLRYNVDRSRWYKWSGHTWEIQPRNGGGARELAKKVARRLPEDGPEGASKTLKHKRYSLSDRGLSAMLKTAESDSALTIRNADLDSRAYELNTPGGIVDLTTGELMPPDPSRLHSLSTSCTPDPEADATQWLDFLVQTFPDEDVRGYVKRLVGYSLIGEVRDHVLPFAYGNGGNGKGVFLETIKGVLGEYSSSAPAGFLMSGRGQQHPTEYADLNGRRFVISSEVNQGDKFDEAKVKALTGGDTVKGRFMGQDFFEFTPTHHMWLMGNDQPEVDSGGDAFWRRLRLIPFIHKVPEDKVIQGLQTILARDYGPAVLQWAIDGAVEYLKVGLMEPEGVTVATSQYAQSADTIGRFIEECCLTGSDTFTSPVAVIRSAYEQWCRQLGEQPIPGRSFTTQLSRHGVKTGKDAPRGSGGMRLYGGIMLAPQHEEQNREPRTLDRLESQNRLL